MPVVHVACCCGNKIGLPGRGHVWTCDRNDRGQLGHSDRTAKHLFTLVDPGHFEGASIVIAAGGLVHSVVASAEGDVLTWGSGTFGRLGHNDGQDRLAPARLGTEQFGGGKMMFVTTGGRANILSTADSLHHHCKLGGGCASIPGTSVYK